MNFRLASLDSINLSFMSSQRRWIVMVISSGGWWSPEWSDSRLLWSVRSGSLGDLHLQFSVLAPHNSRCQPSVHCLTTISSAERTVVCGLLQLLCFATTCLPYEILKASKIYLGTYIVEISELSFLSIIFLSAHETSHFPAAPLPDA